MKPASPLSCLALSILPLLSFLAEPLCAQEAAQAGPRTRPPRPGSALREAEETISFEFPGGTLTQYAAFVQEAAGGNLNVVLDEKADEVSVPAVSLKNVSVPTALALIESSVKDGAKVNVETVRQGREGSEVYVVRVIKVVSKPAAPAELEAPAPPAKIFQVFALKTLLKAHADGQKIVTPLACEAVLTAIDTALAIQAPDAKEKPVIKYHPESGLLLVRGTEEQLGAVSQVLEQLTAPGVESPVLDATLHDGDLLETVARLEAELEKLKAEIAELKKKAATKTQK